MPRRISKKVMLILAGDVLLLWAALFAALSLRRYSHPEERWELIRMHTNPFAIIFLLWLLVLGAFGLYELRIMKNGRIFLWRLLQVMVINVVLAITILYLFPFEIEPRRNLLVIASLATIFIFLWRYLFNLFIARTPAARVIFCGINKEAGQLADYLIAHPQLGYKPVGFIANDDDSSGIPPQIPCFVLDKQTLPHIIRDTKADTIVIAPEMKENKLLVSALLSVIPQGVTVSEFPAFHEMLTGKIPHSLIEEVWFLENLIGIKKPAYERAKRAADLVLAGILGIPAFLFFPFIALAIKLNSRGPIFFRQQRLGKNGAAFEMIKFRSTWRTAAPAGDGWTKEHGSHIYTAVGMFLRRSYLDELPQLINIFKGEMSFVGPRPERPEFVERLGQEVPFYEMRLLVPPGITGWAQMHMENDAAVQDTPEKMQYDLYYIKNRAFMLDLLIMLRTASALMRRQGR